MILGVEKRDSKTSQRTHYKPHGRYQRDDTPANRVPGRSARHERTVGLRMVGAEYAAAFDVRVPVIVPPLLEARINSSQKPYLRSIANPKIDSNPRKPPVVNDGKGSRCASPDFLDTELMFLSRLQPLISGRAHVV